MTTVVVYERKVRDKHYCMYAAIVDGTRAYYLRKGHLDEVSERSYLSALGTIKRDYRPIHTASSIKEAEAIIKMEKLV